MINDTPTYHDVPTYRVPTYPYPLPSIGRWSHQFDCYISNRFQYNRCAGDSCHGRTEKTNDARFMTYQLMGTTYIPLRFPPSGVVPVNWRRNNTTYNMTVWRYGAYNTTGHEGIYWCINDGRPLPLTQRMVAYNSTFDMKRSLAAIDGERSTWYGRWRQSMVPLSRKITMDSFRGSDGRGRDLRSSLHYYLCYFLL